MLLTHKFAVDKFKYPLYNDGLSYIFINTSMLLYYKNICIYFKQTKEWNNRHLNTDQNYPV